MFADDCTFACAIDRSNLDNAHIQINSHILPLLEWINANRIKINVDKTKFMMYSYRKEVQLLHPVRIGDIVIQRTDRVKFLGMLLDDRLIFSHHVSYVASKIVRVLGMMFKLREFVPLNILKSPYFAPVYPYVCYAVELWYGALNYVKNEIQVLQKGIIRTNNFLPYNEHTATYFASY